MLEHELDDRCGIDKAVWSVTRFGFLNDLDITFEFLVSFFNDQSVLFDGHDPVVCVADHGEDRNLGFGQRCEVVDWI